MTIALIAPGSRVTPEALPGIISSIESRYGVSLTYGDDLTKWHAPEARADIIIRYLKDPAIVGLWAIRGGEGTADIMPFIDARKAELTEIAPKQLLGFSDVVPLLLYFYQTLGWKTVLHGQANGELLKPAPIKSLCDRLSNPMADNPALALSPLNKRAKDGKPNGPLLVANLSMAQLSLKECWEIKPAGHVFVLEDWHEKGYVVARTLKHFMRIGLFSGIKALILGDFLAGDLEDPYLPVVLERFAASCDFPVYQTQQVGHGPYNMPLLLGAPLQLTIEGVSHV